MKFSELVYDRVTLENTKQAYELLISQLKATKSMLEGLPLLEAVSKLQRHLMSMQNLCELRYKQDLSDAFYNQEIAYWHQVSPLFDELHQQWLSELKQVSWLEELNQHLPVTYWQSSELDAKLSSEALIPLLQEENRLVGDYLKLVGQIKINFDGQSLNLSQLGAYQNSNEPEVREAAWQARAEAFEALEEQIDEYYDQLIQLRDKMAKMLGFKNFTEMGYARLKRVDYDQKAVETLRKGILEEVTPVASKVLKHKLNGNTWNTLIDEKYSAKQEHLSEAEVIEMGRTLFNQFSASDFYEQMLANEYVDLASRSNKEGGGYCSYLPTEKMPFVYTNFQGTISDFTVFTHEFGHAYQKYQCRDLEVFDCQSPTMELAEIHSMSMEIFAYEAIKDQEKQRLYQQNHLSEAITFLPYAALIDAFEHEVYTNPTLSKQQRKAKFRVLEKAYLPQRTYGNCSYFERGNWWQQQGHIFFMPFYYLDYAIARICSLQFYSKIRKQEDPRHDYIRLCQLGGYESFIASLEKANLSSPFSEGVLKDIILEINSEIQ